MFNYLQLHKMDEKIKSMTNWKKGGGELSNARVEKYREKKCTVSQQLNSSMQDDPTEEM